MPNAQQSKNLNKLIIVAALGYFVDIYDLLLFGVERTESLNVILPIQYPGISDAVLKTLNGIYGKLLLNWQMFGMLLGGVFWGITVAGHCKVQPLPLQTLPFAQPDMWCLPRLH